MDVRENTLNESAAFLNNWTKSYFLSKFKKGRRTMPKGVYVYGKD
jgi:hypothetical protein